MEPGWEGHRYRAVIRFASNAAVWETWRRIYCSLEENHEGGPKAALAFFKSHEQEMMRGTLVLWREKDDYYRLMELRAGSTRSSFDSEKQNDPVNPDDCLFSETDFTYWDDDRKTATELIREIGTAGQIIGAVDPSLGKHGRRGDGSAIVTILLDTRTQTRYVIDADIADRKPADLIAAILAKAQVFDYSKIVIEDNHFQTLLVDELRRRAAEKGISLPIQGRTNTNDKIARIEAIQPRVTSGQVRFSRRHFLLLEQLRRFPMGAHDDGPDALEMAITASKSHYPVEMPTRIRNPLGPPIRILPPGYKSSGLLRFFGSERSGR